MSAVVSNSDLFIPLSTVFNMVRAGFNNEPRDLKSILLNNVETYLSVSGLFEFYKNDQSGEQKKLTYVSGLCLASRDAPPPDAYPDNYGGNISIDNYDCNLYATNYTSLDMSNFQSEAVSLTCADGSRYSNQYLSMNAYFKLKDVFSFLKETQVPISPITFINFFTSCYKDSIFSFFDDFEGQEDELKRDFYFNELCEVFGSEYLEMIEISVPLAIENIVEIQNKAIAKKNQESNAPLQPNDQDYRNEEFTGTELIRTQRALMLAIVKLASTSNRLRKPDGKPNISTIVNSLLEQFKDGKGPRGFGNTTITNSINAALDDFYKEIHKLI